MRRLLAILVALAPVAGEAAVAFAANGNTTVTAGTGTCTPSTTTLGTVGADDIILLVATGEGDGSGGSLALTTANGFVAVTGSPISADDNDATEETTEVDTGVWWVRGSSWTAAPVVTDSGDHTTCALHRFTGAVTTGDPWDVLQTSTETTSDTSASITGASTTVTDTLVVLVLGHSNNGTSGTTCSAWTNAGLGSLTERFDSTNTSGLGGGHCLAEGTRAATGAFGATTATLSVASQKAMYAIALKPQACTGVCIESQASATPLNNSASTSLSATGPTTTNPSMIVASTSWACSAAVAAATVSGGTGLSWTKQREDVITGTFAGFTATSVWTAWSTANQSGQTLTSTRTAGSTNCAATLTVWSVTGAQQTPLGNTGGTAGVSNGTCTGTPNATLNVTVNAQRSGNLLFGAVTGDTTGTALTADANSTLDSTVHDTTNQNEGATARKTAQTSGAGNATFGATQTGNGGCYAMSGLEVCDASGCGTGNTYNDPVTEAVTAAESLASAHTMPNALTEAVTAADSLSAAGSTWPNAVTEAVSAGDSLVGGILTQDPVAEGVTAADSLADTYIMGESTIEAVVAADSLSTIAVFDSSVAEAASAADSLFDAHTMPEAFSEAVTAGSTLLDMHTMAQGVSEEVAAQESLFDEYIPAGGGPQTYNEALTERVTLLAEVFDGDLASELRDLRAGLKTCLRRMRFCPQVIP